MRKKNESVELSHVNHVFMSPFFFMRIKKKNKHRKALHPQNDFGVEAFFKTDCKFGRSLCFFFSLSLSCTHTQTHPRFGNFQMFIHLLGKGFIKMI